VPLSEHEQRLFEEIERSLADDPKFASAVRANDPRHHARRKLIIAGVILLVGLGVLITGAVLAQIAVAVIGFVIMLGGPALALQPRRRFGRTTRLRVVGSDHPSRRQRRPRRRTRTTRAGNFIDRLEDRWHNRPEGHR
jgi:DUF3040 family protein